MVCRRRNLGLNQIVTIASETLVGLTALTTLYDTGLWVGWAWFLAAKCLRGFEALRAHFARADFRPASFCNGIITSFLHFLAFLICTCLHTLL
jgi:hypothetical protein